MTIEIKSVDAGLRSVSRSGATSNEAMVTAATEVTTSEATAGDAATVDAAQMQDAANQLNTYLATRSSPPEYSVDYLSGLSVVTVRAAATGETLYQLPGSEAVRLARLLKEGGSLDSFGALDTAV